MKNDSPETTELILSESEYKILTRRRFILGGFLASLIGCGIGSIYFSKPDRGLRWPLRYTMDRLDAFWYRYFKQDKRAQNYPDRKNPPRVYGNTGMLSDINIDQWRLEIRQEHRRDSIYISLDQIKALPKVTETFEFKCIEGWSEIMTFTGVKFSDFMKAYGVGYKDQSMYDFVGLSTVNNGYYVSVDMKSMLHPQTLLCYEMNGAPLTHENGSPLRLASSVKYGIKSIKQIGKVSFGSKPFKDFWGDKGTGYYLGL